MLSLNTPASERPHRIVWNPESTTDIKEASEKITELLTQGWKVTSTTPGQAVLSPPDRPEHQGLMRILDESGDSRLLWDRRKPDEVKEAFAKFKELTGKGYKGFLVRSDGSKGSRLDEFDALLGEILMGKGGKKDDILMVPPTMPS